jgi:hypothetical protein
MQPLLKESGIHLLYFRIFMQGEFLSYTIYAEISFCGYIFFADFYRFDFGYGKQAEFLLGVKAVNIAEFDLLDGSSGSVKRKGQSQTGRTDYRGIG